jgi:hypothetical protein
VWGIRGPLTAPESGCSEKTIEREIFYWVPYRQRGFWHLRLGRTNLVKIFYWCIDPSTYIVFSTATTVGSTCPNLVKTSNCILELKKESYIGISRLMAKLCKAAFKNCRVVTEVLYICFCCWLLAVGSWIMGFISNWDKNLKAEQISQNDSYFDRKWWYFQQQSFLSQLEMNNVIHEPTASNWHRSRAPKLQSAPFLHRQIAVL